MEISGGYEPDDGSGQAAYVVRVRDQSKSKDLGTFLVPYKQGGLVIDNLNVIFDTAGSHILRFDVVDSVGSRTGGSTRVVVQEPPALVDDWNVVIREQQNTVTNRNCTGLRGTIPTNVTAQTFHSQVVEVLSRRSLERRLAHEMFLKANGFIGRWLNGGFDANKAEIFKITLLASFGTFDEATGARDRIRTIQPGLTFSTETSPSPIDCNEVLDHLVPNT